MQIGYAMSRCLYETFKYFMYLDNNQVLHEYRKYTSLSFMSMNDCYDQYVM